ncbi:uncharacterized protein [Leptinotarsa decemlineata]|uniref:uncharacterized protein n=1 Tax=Leptinotarsa decemlineata TaxID=7539 RepID=UPI003D304089
MSELREQVPISLPFGEKHNDNNNNNSLQKTVKEHIMCMLMARKPYNKSKVVILEDSRISPNTEKIIQTKIAGTGGLSTASIEPSNASEAGMFVARSLVTGNNQTIPVRIINLNNNRLTLKKRQVIGNCEPILKIAKIEEKVPQQLAKELTNSFKKTWSHLSEEELCKVARFVEEVNDMFLKGKIIARTDLIPHWIDISDAKPIRQPPRRLPFAKQDQAASIVEDMLEEGVIEKSNSPWSSPIGD